MEMELKSQAFENGEKIPTKYTCNGEGIIPPMEIDGVPAKARSLALVVDDPDAPSGTFVHWLVWNIDPKVKEIKEDAKRVGVKGINDAGGIGYTPPCPPRGPSHTYRFRVYALDIMLDLKSGADVPQLEAAMEGHVLAQAKLDGEFGR